MSSINLSKKSRSQNKKQNHIQTLENTQDFLSIYKKSIYVNNFIDKYWNFIGYENPIEDIEIELESEDEENYIDDWNYYEDYIKK